MNQPPAKKEALGPKRAEKAFRILALDYGRTKIGLALADSEARMAQPYDTLERINRNEDMRRLRELAGQLGVRQILVGLPLRLDGSSGEMAEQATRFAEENGARTGRQVHRGCGGCDGDFAGIPCPHVPGEGEPLI